ncbi:hypothetical protein [Deinococcus reticulitermitis]|uniref:hypothetical protein n=1 Tax=Deinococcus reticulitermitis TaxID=856736 RepID=UPI0011609689|nr:hypothetical protein [Deinococcus reticulitermitis]
MNVSPVMGLLVLGLVALLLAGVWWYYSRPGKPQPAPTPITQTRTPAQNLAILSGRPADDAAIAAALARLDALCPEDEAQVADLVVNLQSVLEKAGKHYEIPELVETLTKAQEGSEFTCVDAATTLSLMLERQ